MQGASNSKIPGGNRKPSTSLSGLNGLAELSEKSRQNISKWPKRLQLRVNHLITQQDPVIKAAVEQAAEQNSVDKVTRLIRAMQNKPAVPKSPKQGKFFAKGGTSKIYEVEGHPELLMKPGGGRLPNEARAMVEMEMIGISTVYVKKTTADNGQNILLIKKINGVGSKDIIGRIRSPFKPPQKTDVVTQKTIDDLERIHKILLKNRANVGDFQFIIRRSDGSVFVNDPVSYIQGKGPSGDIVNIIERFKKILREKQK
jgi:hypothetical protein